MSQSTFCRPKLLINEKEVAFCNSASFSSSETSLQSFSASITEPDLENVNLFNEKVEFYLNYGGEDGTPLFRGYIKSFRAQDSSINISAYDPRSILSGKDALPIVIDDKDNYDGQTIVQFLLDVIENSVNINETLISTEFLNEMDKPIYMTDIRSSSAPYDTVKNLISKKRDDDNILSVLEYFFDIKHGGKNSGIIIKKTKELTDDYDFLFSYNDGIIQADYTERAPPSYAIVSSDDGTQVKAEYGNAPLGNVGIKLGETFSSRAEAKERGLAEILLKQNDTKEIQLRASKGFYCDLGQIIRLEVPDSNLVGQYRITEKNIDYSSTEVSCTFTLNKKPIRISDFI